MRTVNEISKITGVSVRTLHYYDAIGLLKPSRVTDAGYRLYDDTALSRLQSILLFRELQFPLKDIKAILDSPVYDPAEALAQQLHLLELQKKHIEKLISLARELQSKGVDKMDFEAFNKEEMTQYAAEARERWGSTRAYAEYSEKFSKRSDREKEEAGRQLMTLFADLGALKLKGLPPADSVVQEKVAALQQHITENYYTCTNEILSGLGQMYLCDERMKRSIDKAGGEGAAEFAAKAISVYCAS